MGCFKEFIAGLALLTIGVLPAHANLITNGDFGTGDFTGWTLGTTANGSLGFGAASAHITSFNVTGSGATTAAQFAAGGIVVTSPFITQYGGWISQDIFTGAGNLIFSANLAAYNPNPTFGNGEAGVFSVLLDGVTLDTEKFGSIGTLQTINGRLLSFDNVVTAGSHNVEILITRPFGTGATYQYVTNVTANLRETVAVPEPLTMSFFGAGLAGMAAIRRRRKLAKA